MVKDEEKLEIKVNRLLSRVGELEKSLESKKAQVTLLQAEILEKEGLSYQDKNLMLQEPEIYAGTLLLSEPENLTGPPGTQKTKILSETTAEESLPDSGEGAHQEDCLMLQVVRDFCVIAEKIMENRDYIEYTYATKYSVSFYKIEQEVFDGYVRKYSQLDLKTFLNICIDLMILKSEPNRRQCSYYTGKRRVYYVSRNFMDCAVRKIEEKQDVANA